MKKFDEQKAERLIREARAAGALPTPGPWVWYWREDDEGHADCGVFWEKRTGHAVSICRAPRYEKQQRWEANARLIAAAPDLLEACEMAVRCKKATGPASGVCDSCTRRMEDAIAKARGEA